MDAVVGRVTEHGGDIGGVVIATGWRMHHPENTELSLRSGGGTLPFEFHCSSSYAAFSVSASKQEWETTNVGMWLWQTSGVGGSPDADLLGLTERGSVFSSHSRHLEFYAPNSLKLEIHLDGRNGAKNSPKRPRVDKL